MLVVAGGGCGGVWGVLRDGVGGCEGQGYFKKKRLLTV